jgi:hypothetical protein
MQPTFLGPSHRFILIELLYFQYAKTQNAFRAYSKAQSNGREVLQEVE